MATFGFVAWVVACQGLRGGLRDRHASGKPHTDCSRVADKAAHA
jgi:hypothetical protein